MLLELADFILGIAFGYFHSGKEDYKGLIRNGGILGLAIGCIFVLVAEFVSPGSAGIGVGVPGGMLGFLVEIILFVVLFIFGAFLGDMLEGVRKK
jgi:hypothetical protein